MVNAKTISPKKRKSVAGNADTPIQAKKAKPDTSLNQTPGKKGNQTPAKKGNQTPAKTPQKKVEKQTPKPATPTPTIKDELNSAKKQNGKPQQSPSSPKKLQKFGGTAELKQNEGQKNEKSNLKKDKSKKDKSEKKTPGSPKRKNKGTFFHLQCKITGKGDQAVVNEIDGKIKEFESRSELTKTARRKLKMLKKLRHVALTGEQPKSVKSEKKEGSNQNLTKSQRKKLNKKQAKNSSEASAENSNKQPQQQQQQQQKQKSAGVDKKQPKQQKQKPTEVKKVTLEPEYSEDGSSESEVEQVEEVKVGKPTKLIKKQAQPDSDDDSDIDEEVDEEEDEDDDSEFGEKVVEEEVEDSSDEEDNDDEEEQEDEEEEEEESESELNATGDAGEAEDSDESDSQESDEPPSKKSSKNNQQKPAQQKFSAAEKKTEKGSSRYVLFVGNLPYDATREDILSHFKKAGPVKDVRIPLDQKTNKPRGFAYLEVENAQVYEKGLSMHHTMVKGRRINVQYSEGGKKKNDDSKNRIKQKNAKFNDMRKKGQLAGSVKEDHKRGARRNKGKKVNGDA